MKRGKQCGTANECECGFLVPADSRAFTVAQADGIGILVAEGARARLVTFIAAAVLLAGTFWFAYRFGGLPWQV